MNIIAVDDETLALDHLTGLLRKASAGSTVQGFSDSFEALRYLEEHAADLVFLDIEMCGMNGIALAKRMKDLRPGIGIVFVTGYSNYALDAFSVRANGYLLKPATLERVREEIEQIDNRQPFGNGKRIRVQTFGNFEAFVDGKPLRFSRSKSKELLAYLVDRKGAGCGTANLCSILWEDKEYTLSIQKQFQTIVSDLIKTLKSVNAEDMLIKKRNDISIDISKFDCDYYDFLKGDIRAVNSYAGEYMSNYSWAEFTTGFLFRREKT